MEKQLKRRKLSSSPKSQSLTKMSDGESGEEDGAKDKKEESSPERCPICLAPPENPAKSDSCCHYFCFNCLKEWSKVKAECPLCKMPIRSIFYDIKTDDDYQEYKVKDHKRDAMTNCSFLGFPTSSNFSALSSFRFRMFRDMHRNRENEMAATAAACNTRTIRQRRMYYWSKTKVQRVDTGNRIRDISAEFYRENPGQMHRLEPWLRRELTVLYGFHNRALISRVRDLIMSSVATIGITSQTFVVTLQPYLLEHTNQFVHEFLSFARSPYDIHQYDRHANYAPEGPSRGWAPPPNRGPSSGWDSGADSGENTRGHTDQSMMLSQTTWGDDEASLGPVDAGPRRRMPYFLAMEEDLRIGDFSQLHLDQHRGYFLPPNRSTTRDVEAPLLHQTLNVNRPGGSSARDYQRMERMRRHLGEHFQRNENRKRQAQPKPRISSGSQSNHPPVIVISSDSSDKDEETCIVLRSAGKTLHYKPSTSMKRLQQNDRSEQPCHIKKEKRPNSQSDSSLDSDEHSPFTEGNSSDIEFVKYIKPPHLRTPDAFIDLSSADDDAPGPSTRHSGGAISRSEPSVPLPSASSSESSSDEQRKSRYGGRRSSSGSSSQVQPRGILQMTKEFLKKARRSSKESNGVRHSGDEAELDVATAMVSFNNDAAEGPDTYTPRYAVVSSPISTGSQRGITTSAAVASPDLTLPQNRVLVSPQAEVRLGPKKIFERRKVSVNFPKPKKGFYDSDSDSEIDVGVEEVRLTGTSSQGVKNSSHELQIVTSPPTGTSLNDSSKVDERSWSHENESSTASRELKRKRDHDPGSGLKRKKKRRKRLKSRRNSQSCDGIPKREHKKYSHGTCLEFSSKHKKSKKTKWKHRKRSRSSSVEFVSHVKRD